MSQIRQFQQKNCKLQQFFERGLILLALPSPTTIFFAKIPAVRKGCFFCLWGMPVAQQTARCEAPRMRSIWFDTGGARERRERYPSPTTIFLLKFRQSARAAFLCKNASRAEQRCIFDVDFYRHKRAFPYLSIPVPFCSSFVFLFFLCFSG